MTHMVVTARAGRLELDEPRSLPDGAKFVAIPLDEASERDSDEPNSPEEIARILAILDQMKPLEYTPDELARLDADRLERKQIELANAAAHADKLKAMWE